jgi:isoleucyl-tRNA synthetase
MVARAGTLPYAIIKIMADLDLKATVNLPKTTFPMEAKLAQNEPKLLERWQKEDLYGRIRQARRNSPLYILHDGPPYANGNIHLGTALNKILKDFIVKSKTMAGFNSPFVPGWDCHGLPIEIKVDQELGARKARMSALAVRAACRRYAEKYVNLQRRSFERLGVFGEWSRPYLTMSADYESTIAATFVDMLAGGYVYKDLKPVHWCMHDRTALAEAEVEYENESSPSIWVKFALAEGAERIAPALAGRRVSVVIWTTTPWTIPANMAVAFHPKLEYAAAEGNDGGVYIVARSLLEATTAHTGLELRPLAVFPGERLEGLAFRHPFLNRISRGILAAHVTLEQGTGAVHTAPGHGLEDYLVGRQYDIPTYCPVDAEGKFFQAAGVEGPLPAVLIGKTVWEANPIVIDLLDKAGALLANETIGHSYPHCWRCHHATIFRATEQWFIGMERNDLRRRTLEEIRRVKWIPAWGEERIANMIATRPDWCISRQRVWGVPITVFYCQGCGQPVTDRAVLDPVVDLFRERTADVWFELEAEQLMPPGTRCRNCGGAKFRKESDILDVWFDSGSSHLAVLGRREDLPWPSDLYLEGGDQYRGWFHSSLLIGMGVRGRSPYRACATHGWTLDAEGKAMSKSLGNTIEPEDIIRSHGAEILRLWVSSFEFSDDARISQEILARLSEAYRKLRNTFRYMLGNLYDFDPARHAVGVERMLEIDQWALLRAETVMADCLRWYEEFAFHKVHHALLDFATVDLSSLYFDILKDRLYTSAPHWPARRSAQTALYRIAHALVRLLAPLLSFTCEEVWGRLPRMPGDPDSVHLARFPSPGELASGLPETRRKRLANWDRLMDVRPVVLKALEQARQEKFIGNALEARLKLSVNGELGHLLADYAGDLPMFFLVSQVELERSDSAGAELQVSVERAAGRKCERCWKYSTDVGANPEYPTICESCARAVEEIKSARR